MKSSGWSRSDAVRNLRQLRHSPASWAVAAVVMVIEIPVSLAGGYEDLPGFFETLGLSRREFFTGKVWELVSYGVLHGGFFHALLNALFVLLVGSRVEHIVGRSSMLRVLFFGIVGGGIGHLLIGSGLLVGLSGGCVALLIFLTTLSPDSRMSPLRISGRNLGIGFLVVELSLALMDPALGIPGIAVPGRWLSEHSMGAWFQMGHACHVGGGVAGWFCGRWLLRPRVSLDRLRHERTRREAR